MKMLTADQEYFSRKFSEAENFLREAKLRWECFSLACKKRNGWEDERFRELLGCPACEEEWFCNLIEQAKERG